MRVDFEWLEGGAFLAEKMGDQAIWIVGRDGSSEMYTILYFDARSVSRVYKMSLARGVWKIWRNVPGFSQRFAGSISQDGNTISSAWEKSFDGSTWEKDFDLTYTKVSQV